MSEGSLPPREPSQPGSRILAARAKVVYARRVVAVAAAGAFGLGLLLARATHPAASSQTSHGLRTPSALAAEVQGGSLRGGSIQAASGPPSASTHTS